MRLLVETSARGIAFCGALLLSGCAGVPDTEQFSNRPSAPPSWEGLPVYDHIVIVVEENKDYSKIDDGDENSFIIGNKRAPFINRLSREGANLTRMYAEEHYSQGNYFWLLSGSNQGVGYFDCVPPPGSIHAENLASQLIAHGRSFKGFSEGLPSIGSTVDQDSEREYARKHVPWVAFSNIPNDDTPDSSNLRFADFPRKGEFHKLPTVAFVIPNLKHDMHDDTIEKDSVERGDTWLKDNLGDYYEWAKTNNSLLIVTFDENDQAGWFGFGPTNPVATDPPDRNQIVTILAGEYVKPGDHEEGPGVTHVNLLRTIEAMYGLNRSGKQQGWALKARISDEKITDVFEPVTKKKKRARRNGARVNS